MGGDSDEGGVALYIFFETKLKERGFWLFISVVVMLIILYIGIVEIYDMSFRNYMKTVSSEEPPRPDFLPPDAVVINTGQRSGTLPKEDYDVILGAVTKWVLAGVFMVWCILRYWEEKKATKLEEQHKRKVKEMEINLMLYKEKRRKEQEEKYGATGDGRDENKES